MDVLSRSHRFSYAAAFGILSNLCFNVIVNQQYAFEYDGPTYFKVFVVLLTMLINGVTYYPLFAALAVQNSLGYFIGTLFAWAYAGVYISNTFICTYNAINFVTLFINEGPIMLCHLYLIFSLPIRFVWSFKRKRKLKFAVDFDSSADLYDSIRNSYQGIHVRKLYAKPPPPPR
ncbi:hypothetical protein FSP39_002290 [Pinctada imbricata]|uniref:Uncharacterized protein n=1 Tax=Pinctada imbricata TaxID=66713 RepID=A0AA88Y8U5_PINIB|nr:hypothetical protein FSP39_002290 [Pinctada imbricata]